MRRQPFTRVEEKRDFAPGECFSVDLSGPQTRSIDGYLYFLLFIDHGSNFVYASFLRSKESDEVAKLSVIFLSSNDNAQNQQRMFTSK